MYINSKKYLGFDDKWLLILGVPITTVLVSVMIYGPVTFYQNLTCLFIASIFVIAYWGVFRTLLMHYHKRFPSYEFSLQRLFYIAIRVIVFYFLVKYAIVFFLDTFLPQQQEFYKHNRLGGISEELSQMILLASILFIYEGAYYFNKSKMIEIEKNKLERITAEQKLNTLKNQVNPHFLFNSLNTLTTLIPEDQDQAIHFTQELSKTYRTILEVRNEKLITIKQELDALNSYIYLLKTRFKDKVQIEINVSDAHLKEFIIPVSLQILIENAVKHNIVSKSKPLVIKISTDQNFLIVSNNLQRKNQEFLSTKIGLNNLTERYQLMVAKDVQVEETEAYFKVKLPIIKNLNNP